MISYDKPSQAAVSAEKASQHGGITIKDSITQSYIIANHWVPT